MAFWAASVARRAPLAVVFDEPPIAVEDHQADRPHHVVGFE